MSAEILGFVGFCGFVEVDIGSVESSEFGSYSSTRLGYDQTKVHSLLMSSDALASVTFG